ncbi:MAG: hypothetical protein E7361_04460 [Clostridiales bacterium]|nr:hypothetical protein [Clostridiales bacterium]
MKKKIFIILTIVLLITGIILAIILIPKNTTAPEILGVWWWNDKLDTNTYMDFAKQNSVTEIYYCSSKFDNDTSSFITTAKNNDISVYWLAGEYQWLDDNSNLISKIEKYITYQDTYQNSSYNGIHLDIEPHQNPDFDIRRSDLILSLIQLANTLNTTYPDIEFHYDIPFWLDDEILYNGIIKPAYQHMIDIADRVFVMSYRDTSEKIEEVALDELNYAKSQNKPIMLCVETYSTEGDKVSFMEEGNIAMMSEITKLQKKYMNDIGFAIHHIKSWKELKD